ncbi:MAG: hypothetical protein RR424_00520 [Oscillospiraceae bacterium]
MKKSRFRSLLAIAAALCIAVSLCVPVNAAAKRISFTFTRNDTEYARKTNNTPTRHTAEVNPSIKGIEGYIVMYARTHSGDGTKLAKPDKAVAAPSQCGVYKAIVEFSKSSGYLCENGTLMQEYDNALTIRRIHQTAPELHSSSADLVENEDRQGGTISVGGLGVLSTMWSSGVTPIYSWSVGSNEVVQMEEGKPARFTALAPGKAILTVHLPEDNNHYASEETSYTVTVTSDKEIVGNGYKLVGDKAVGSDWFRSSVEVVAQKGNSGIVVTGPNPVTDDGITSLGVQIKAIDGSLSSDVQIKVKKDSTAPLIENISVNDSPWSDAPLGESAWAAATSLTVKAQIKDEASGIAKMEYRIDNGEYQSDENDELEAEGIKSIPYAHTISSGGAHTLWLRVTDWAGNRTEKSIGINLGITAPKQGDTSSSSVPPSADAITTPTQGMTDLKARLDYLHKSNIEATVAGDVKANANYIEKTLDMYKELSVPERAALGAEDLVALEQYFTMLYLQTGRAPSDLKPLFTFTEKIESSQSSSSISQPKESASEAAAREENIPAASNAAPKAASSEVNIKKDGTNNIKLLGAAIPIVVLIAAISIYFVWKKKLNAEQDNAPSAQAPEDELTQLERMLDSETYNKDSYDDFDDLL